MDHFIFPSSSLKHGCLKGTVQTKQLDKYRSPGPINMDPSARPVAQRHDAKRRTQDILLDEIITFKEMSLHPPLLSGLEKSGFTKPSPIQLSAIPMGRCGLDLVVQAKSGTGKTCVFITVALEAIDFLVRRPQVLVLAPTREIALQIELVARAIGQDMTGLKCYTAIGGLSLKEDKLCVNRAQIVVGTPGRIKQLMELSYLDVSSIKLAVLDEADKLMEKSFQDQINWIYSGLPETKQVIAASATYSEALVSHLINYMHDPTFIRLNSNDPVLLGVRQYLKVIDEESLPIQNYNNKTAALISILSQMNFQQCLVFSNLQTRAENLGRLLANRGWPATHIAGSQAQTQRIEAISQLKSYGCRILISTDLTSRGIDADRVDLVINLDLPPDHETYLHRVGRAGRFGANGAAISIVFGREVTRLREIAERINTSITPLPDEIPTELIHNPLQADIKKSVQIESFQIKSTQPPSQPNIPPRRNGTGICGEVAAEQPESHDGGASTPASNTPPDNSRVTGEVFSDEPSVPQSNPGVNKSKPGDFLNATNQNFHQEDLSVLVDDLKSLWLNDSKCKSTTPVLRTLAEAAKFEQDIMIHVTPTNENLERVNERVKRFLETEKFNGGQKHAHENQTNKTGSPNEQRSVRRKQEKKKPKRKAKTQATQADHDSLTDQWVHSQHSQQDFYQPVTDAHDFNAGQTNAAGYSTKASYNDVQNQHGYYNNTGFNQGPQIQGYPSLYYLHSRRQGFHDRLRGTLNKHWFNVYRQHAYITGMASRQFNQ